MLIDILFLLLAAVIIVPLCQRIGLSSVLGYLAAGLIVGPHLLAMVQNVEEIHHIAELGVVFLLFVIGLELKPQRLWTMRHQVFGMGMLQVLITGAILTFVSYSFDYGVRTSITIGFGLALSSTAFVLQLLTERGSLQSQEGRMSFGVLLFQDIAVVPLLLMVSALAPQSGDVGKDVSLGLLIGLGALTSVILIGRYAVRPMLRIIAASGNHEVFTATAVLLVIGTAWLMDAVGLSMALGAFLAGVLLSGSEFRHQITADVEHFRGLLLGLFFMSVGMTIDVTLFNQFWSQIIFTVILLLSIKIAIIYPLARVFKADHTTALRSALYLSQAGEFGFVLFALAASVNLLTTEQHSTLLLAIVISMISTPFLFNLAVRLTQKSVELEVPEKMHSEQANIDDHTVLIAGFGRFGEQVAKVLQAGGVPFVAIDNNPATVIKAHDQSLPVYFGDVARPNVLKHLHANQSMLAIITLDQPLAVERAITALHTECPRVPIFARARDANDSRRLHDMGVETTIPETLESSLQLAATVLFRLGVKKAQVLEIVNQFRDEDYLLMHVVVTDEDTQ